MSASPNIIVHPQISGVIGGPSSIGAVAKQLVWPPVTPLFAFQPGTGAGQMDTWYDGYRALASAANESLDVSSGAGLFDPFGEPIAFSHIKLFAMLADKANTTDLTVGNGASPFLGALGAGANTFILKPGDLALFVRYTTGYPVADGASDLLKVANSAGAVAHYSILLGGTSV